MKRQVSLLIVILMIVQSVLALGENPYVLPYDEMQTVREYYADDVSVKPVLSLQGDTEYDAQVSAYNFKDVQGKEKAEAIRLAIYGITEGVGEKRFAPNDELTNIAALMMLTRMFGDEDKLLSDVSSKYGEAPNRFFYAALKDAYYAEAKRLNILDQGEEVAYGRLVDRQNLARWLVNGGKIGLKDPALEYFQKVNWQAVEPRNIAPVKTVLENDLMTLSGNDFRPNAVVTRGQMAKIVGAYYDKFRATEAPENNFEIAYGIVVGKKVDSIAKQTVYKLRLYDNQLAEIVLDNSGEKTGLAVYKNGELRDDSVLALGDEIAYYTEGGSVKYAEVLAPFEVTRKMLAHLARDSKLSVNQGKVLSNLMEKDTAGVSLDKRRLRLLLDNDAIVDLVSYYDHKDNSISRYPIVNGSSYILPSAVPVGSEMTIYTLDDRIVYATMGKQPLRSVKGFIRAIGDVNNPKNLTIYDFNNNIIKASVDDDTRLSINYYDAKLSDLKVGVYADMILIGDRIKSLQALSYQPEAGRIPAKGRIVFGDIKSLAGNIIELDSGSCLIDDQTEIVRSDRQIESSDLKVGDSLKIYFDAIDTNVASKIVASDDNAIKYLLKGKLYNYNQHSNEMELAELSRMHNTNFESNQKLFSDVYQLADKAEIYDADKKLTSVDLNSSYYKRSAYFVVREHFGRDQIMKVVFQDGFERHYNSAIGDYSPAISRFELTNRINFDYGDETIFMKNDRIVDKDVLSDNAGAYVLANQKSGNNTAMVVSLLDGPKFLFDNVYIGTLESVNPYDIEITNYVLAKDFRFSEPTSKNKTLYLSDETDIYNTGEHKSISREALFNGPYGRSENKNENKNRGMEYNHYYGIFVTDGHDNLLSCNLRYQGWFKNQLIDYNWASAKGISKKLKDILSETRFTKGRVVGFTSKWQRIEITDASYYLPYYRHWKKSQSNMYIELDGAVIMKNGERISYNDIKNGDFVSAIRYDEEAFVLYVE